MAVKKRSWQYILADVISLFTNPVLIVFASIIAITYYFAPNFEHFWHWALVACVFLLGPSGLYTFWIWYREKKIDIDLTKREDRLIPLSLATVGAVVGAFCVWHFLHYPTLSTISYTLVLMLICLTVVTFVWKISLHAATTASMVSLLVMLVSPLYAVAYILLIPILWSRLFLHRHTKAQLVAGTFAGVAITLVATWAFRN